jgi:hypothetical protein
MDNIIANRDYDIVKKFIEQNIDNSYLSEEDRNRFVECYQSLTLENVKEIYNEVFELNRCAIKKYKAVIAEKNRQFDISMLKIGGIVIAIGLGPVVLCEIAKQYILLENILYQYVDNLQFCSGLVAAFGFCILFAVGH